MKGRWFGSERDGFLKGMSLPFRNVPSLSDKAKASRDREANVDTFIKRITPQIIESHEAGFTWNTPEEWDENFYKLGGGQSRRRSDSILSRISSWEKFIEISEKIIDNQD